MVADSNNQCVQLFSLEGECKLRFGVRGRGPGQMQRPCGVTATPDGNYVVSDFENRCLSVFDPLGKLVRRIGHGKLQGQFVSCSALGLLVAPTSPPVRQMVRGWRRPEALRRPASFRCDLSVSRVQGVWFATATNRLMVADSNNQCVQLFSLEGECKLR
ncbi:tripartite motif-containing protein 2-like [Pollicipes pollicipes]|uniref:tripartite motif-containing protein 2-like n=1 Tax=Pollicipes pollicipes TaxID=41117 RepID=UPI0018852C2F|nr:tripartite motif-containing protein 2-like [Pollicipes pollicipes]